MEKTNCKRFDNIDRSQWMTTPFSRTAEGFLKGRAIVTSVGVFTYIHADGSIQRELRLPEEVFSPESLNSLKLKPVTLNHPSELVTPDNADMLQVGTLGDNPSETTQTRDYNGNWIDDDKITDGINLAVDMCITKKEAIDAVLNGKQALSMGYTCDLEMAEPGSVWAGIEYDYIQRNIRYNHCAIVDSARAGDNAKIELRIDSSDAVLQNKLVAKNDGGTKMLKKVNLDGIEYEAEESVIKALNAHKDRADKAELELDECKKKMQEDKEGSEKKISELTANCDTQKERADKAEEELKVLKESQLDKAKLDEAVQAKLELLDNARKAEVEVKNDMSDLDIKKAIITSVFPKANFDGKDEVYIQARYDGALEVITEKADSSVRQATADVPETHTDSADAREKMIARMTGKKQEEK